jgi:hypothetical protein
MPLFTCQQNCRVSLRWGEPGVCPFDGHGLTAYTPPSGTLAVNWSTGCVRESAVESFRGKSFASTRFVPKTCRGSFDCRYAVAGQRIDVVVNLFPTFTNIGADEIRQRSLQGPPEQRRAYAELTPWTGLEKERWIEEQPAAVAAAWNDKPFRFRSNKPGWPAFTVTPHFELRIVTSKSDAHIVADVLKTPPSRPDAFNCGGTYVGLDQIIQGNPNASSKAALSSESGSPVQVNADLMGYQVDGQVVFYNIVAHEFGHMIGLPDEYNEGVFSPKGSAAENAYAIHAMGTNELALQAGQEWVWLTTSDSLMSRGTVLLPRHLITVWEALGKMTSPTILPQHWTII